MELLKLTLLGICLGSASAFPFSLFKSKRSDDFKCFASQDGTAMFGNNDKVLEHSDEESCKEACLNEAEFECKSFDLVDGSSCFLSIASSDTHADMLGSHAQSVYYERVPCSDSGAGNDIDDDDDEDTENDDGDNDNDIEQSGSGSGSDSDDEDLYRRDWSGDESYDLYKRWGSSGDNENSINRRGEMGEDEEEEKEEDKEKDEEDSVIDFLFHLKL